MKPQTFAPDFIDRVAKAIREAPPIDRSKRRLNKQETIARLRQPLDALRKRGYSLEEMAATLNKAGEEGDLHITPATLKNYLQRRKRGTRPADHRPQPEQVGRESAPAAPPTTPPGPIAARAVAPVTARAAAAPRAAATAGNGDSGASASGTANGAFLTADREAV